MGGALEGEMGSPDRPRSKESLAVVRLFKKGSSDWCGREQATSVGRISAFPPSSSLVQIKILLQRPQAHEVSAHCLDHVVVCSSPEREILAACSSLQQRGEVSIPG